MIIVALPWRELLYRLPGDVAPSAASLLARLTD
jgi:hypothetical protein